MNVWRIPYPKFGDGPGLERVAAVATRLGVDLAGFGAGGAVIVGSNGKGSTAAMTAALLRESDASVGLFTSPHLFALNDRFNIDGEDISDVELQRHWTRVVAAVDAEGLDPKLGGFEFLFLIAADWFAARGVKHTVWEAGIGGRLDPVRLIKANRVALTSLDLEHTELLGETLEEIARDKVEAAPAGATLYVGESCAPQLDAITAHCASIGVSVRPIGHTHIAPSLPGAHQQQNAALAIVLAQDLVALSDAQIEHALTNTLWPGRLEIIDTDPLIVIDVGHTPAGIRAALDGFAAMRGERDAILVCGVSRDKDVAAIVSILAPHFGHIICAAALHKGAPPAEMAAHAQVANPTAELAIAESVTDASRLALARAKARNTAIYVAGGLFLAAEFKAVHVGRDPASLAFF